MGMQDADDFDSLSFPSINHKMRTAGMNSNRRRKLDPFPGQLGEFGEQIEDRKQSISVALCLLQTPCRGSLQPDVCQIGFSRRPDKPAAISRHSLPASWP